MKNFYEVSRYKLIYVYAIPDDAHKGLLKIGETTISTDLPVKKLSPNSSELKAAAKKRIKDCTNTAGVAAKPLHAELAVADNGKSFGDREVHELLIRSGVEKKSPEGTTAREWFELDLPTAIQAIKAVKQGKKFLAGLKSKKFRAEIILRPEQETAVNKTVKHFQRGGKDFLWNAKMRFGKTLCALEVVRQMNFAKTIIVTHRPVVDAGWFDDFKKIFDGNEDFIYGQKGTDVKDLQASKKNFVYFASIQDLRGSKIVGGKHSKNTDVFGETWDFVIVDEAHEGTQTARGDAVIKKLVKKKTKFLALSGTPFNLIKNFSPESIYTWDYVMEQHAKKLWATEHGDDPNPYADLPTMNILTYNLGELLGKKFSDDEDIIFSFKEFFRTDDAGNFVHEADVKSFLDLLVTENDSNYPFSNEKFCNMFRHTLWRVPGVKAGYALSALLKAHRVFCNFEIANVAGEGDDDAESDDALKLVKTAIKKYERTITISCGKLTTGVTVPQWSAVLMLAGNTSFTSAASYLQTIFRVQTPCDENGVSKQNCYVFDFAPYRALRMLAASIKVSVRPGKTTDDERKTLDALLKFCPVIAVEGSEMNQLDADKLLQRIKSAQAERIVQNGFDDNNLYSDILRDLTDVDLKKFDKLKKIVGVTKKNRGDIVINDQGIDEVEGDGGSKKKTPRTPEQKENDRKNQVKRNAISILTGISIRMPLLIYGADIDFDKEFTIDMFLDPKIVDDDSWAEFMPAGVTREFFKDFMPYYDRDVFIVAGRRVRELAKTADELTPTERVKKIAELFATFKNPDKETVLTPWRVVNLHMTEVFGGWNFFVDNPPQFVPTEIFRADKKILEINSKTGLYPLFVAYSIYRDRLGNANEAEKNLADLQKIWDATVAENVFVICKTPMAKTITRRTLLGYRGGTVNAHCFDDLINTLKNKPKQFVKRVKQENFWNKGSGTMFFDAVVGNPPYQNITDSDSTRMPPVYNHFIDTAFKLADKVSLITPARFLFNAGYTPKEFNERMLKDSHLKVVRYEQDSTEFFPTSDIKGGVVITYRDANENFGAIDTFTPFPELNSIHQKVCVANKNFSPLSKIIRGQMTYRLAAKAYEDFPDLSSRVSERSDTALRTNAFEIMPDIFLTNEPDDGHEYLEILGRVGTERVYRYVRRDYMIDITELNKYKVFLPASNGSGAIGEVLSTPLVGSPLVGCTQTFITVGAFDTEAEAYACLKYIKTKFARAMLGILKVTQHNPPSTWAKVPLQDFTADSDIDWTQPVAQIDEQLYRKYGLSDAEKNFIESHVKAMS